MDVLVTGADTELGRTIAENFRDAGHKVVISGARRDDLEVSAKELDVDAIVREPEVITCWIEIEPGLFQRRKVKLGIEQDGFLQVLEGMKVGERVAARGAIFLDNAWQE